jgi:hypothetical protein
MKRASLLVHTVSTGVKSFIGVDPSLIQNNEFVKVLKSQYSLFLTKASLLKLFIVSLECTGAKLNPTVPHINFLILYDNNFRWIIDIRFNAKFSTFAQ